MIDALLNELIAYAKKKALVEEEDIVFIKNQLMEKLGLQESLEMPGADLEPRELPEIKAEILAWAAETGVLKDNTVTEQDLLDTKLMGVLAERPSGIISFFRQIQEEKGVEAATAWFYKWNQDIDYIRRDRIAKNMSWRTPTEFGDLDITINLSKPEKDPKEIQAAKQAATANYPLCLLCRENVGYAGRMNHPARQNLRTIPVTLAEENWHVQFSPYVYYHEHAIVLKASHDPMKITKQTFQRLLDFVEQYPHYFIGSNADLPIVGGSILSHDHYQAGKYEFPMARAEEEETVDVKHYSGVTAAKVKWPMSVLRVKGENKNSVVEASDYILAQWKQYEDTTAEIYPFSGKEPHHTITPIARYREGKYELDLVLRNNRTSDEHPMGIFHPHQEVHHIKKENIGLIEVMGLAVLPGRLKDELQQLGEALLTEEPEVEIAANETISKHLNWALEVKKRNPHISLDNYQEILQQEVGLIFAEILGHSGVFKRSEEGQKAFVRFMESL
ncbi:UDP-glucose--hexose-1-phosphate uridylyltransferase [Alkalicoccus daliensis]|uniref:Galactose-1-phosphate uridylyltransferase n=1 Tax=Alkalicoccus daliensis TaxID=745820 RepID=A0A1H0IPU1_9BACI|nr:UDP-glucose--hexose-1-phosphate uridylyltransferase [Alkalicoccus daliensis]SDO33372.1 UTP-hexose-1-phosphate uridylyltransferase [Alkalicoccus daliensis]